MKTLGTAFLLFGLVGCATGGPATVTTNIPAGLNNGIVQDSIKQLQALYPPGQTKFNIGQPVSQSDAFGQALVMAIRKNGYAVQAYSPIQPSGAMSGLNFRYTVDKPETNLMGSVYRVKLTVGKSILTRAYIANKLWANPAGAWAVRE